MPIRPLSRLLDRDTPRRRSRLAARLVALAAACGLAGTAASAAEPIHTPETQFNIPFEFDAARLEAVGAREVVLFARHAGGRWTRSGQCGLGESFLTYTAEDDGRYDFALRVRTAENELVPAGPFVPSLAVVVDRTAPSLAISLLTGDGQRPRVVWHSDDSHLDLASLQVETSTDGVQWAPLKIRAAASGQAEPPVPPEGLPLMVRAAVADYAGNIGRATASSGLPTAARTMQITPATRPAVTPQPQAIAGPVMKPAAPRATPARRPLSEVNPFADSSAAADIASVEAAAPPAATPPAAAPQPATPQVSEPGRSVLGVKTVSLASPAAPPAESVATSNVPQTIAAQPGARPAPKQPGVSPSYTAQPSGTVRVNSLEFSIAYALHSVGASGVRQVDAYITENDGVNWFHYGRDEDAVSPLDIAVPREGRYGFSFRVQNGAGITTDPPQPGDRPDVRVEVDATPPTARLLAVEPIGGSSSGTVQIRWNATDRELTAQPILLEWAETPAGPWTPVTSPLENGGRYQWQVPDAMPPSVLVRLTATDVCGNTTQTTTPQPIVVDFSQPSLRVLQVAPR